MGVKYLYKGNFNDLKQIMHPFEYITSGTEGHIFRYKNFCRKVYFSCDTNLKKRVNIHNKLWKNKQILKKLNNIYFVESEWIEGIIPSFQEIKLFLIENNFKFISNKFIFYFRKGNIIMNDTHYIENFIKNDKGIFPIDEKYSNKIKFFLFFLFFRIFKGFFFIEQI
jgi:hypothetical protein